MTKANINVSMRAANEMRSFVLTGQPSGQVATNPDRFCGLVKLQHAASFHLSHINDGFVA